MVRSLGHLLTGRRPASGIPEEVSESGVDARALRWDLLHPVLHSSQAVRHILNRNYVLVRRREVNTSIELTETKASVLGSFWLGSLLEVSSNDLFNPLLFSILLNGDWNQRFMI